MSLFKSNKKLFRFHYGSDSLFFVATDVIQPYQRLKFGYPIFTIFDSKGVRILHRVFANVSDQLVLHFWRGVQYSPFYFDYVFNFVHKPFVVSGCGLGHKLWAIYEMQDVPLWLEFNRVLLPSSEVNTAESVLQSFVQEGGDNDVQERGKYLQLVGSMRNFHEGKGFIQMPFLLWKAQLQYWLIFFALLALSEFLFLDPTWIVIIAFIFDDLQAGQTFNDAYERPFMHDSHTVVFLLLDDQLFELGFALSPIEMQVIQDKNVSIQLQRGALPFGLLHAQTRVVIFQFIIDERKQDVFFGSKFRKLCAQPVIDLRYQTFLSGILFLEFVDFILDLRCLVFESELKDFAFPFGCFLTAFEIIYDPPDHFIFRSFHDPKFDFLVGEPALTDCLVTGDIEPNVVSHGQLVIEVHLFCWSLVQLYGLLP